MRKLRPRTAENPRCRGAVAWPSAAARGGGPGACSGRNAQISATPDKIFFHSDRFPKGDPRRGLENWSTIEAVAGALMEKQDLHPPPVTVRGFPPDEVL